MGRYPEASASLETLDPEEAKRIIRRFDEEGLVHSVWTGMTPFVVGLCNCDRDCGAYRFYIERRGRPAFFRAEYVCQVDPDLCTGCKSCMKQCQFGAQFYSHRQAKVYIDPTRCFGCGVCMAACPADAVKLIPRQQHAKAKDIWLRAPA
jgi:TPP-dependent indolepyruvate ferredoxin oxidoreductase alpha subunit